MDEKDGVEPRKEYRTPEVAVHGAVAEVTRAIGSMSKNRDVQGTGNVKTS